MDKISIVMVTDENYIVPTKVAISSILSSAKKDILFEINILCDFNLNKQCRDCLLRLQDKYSNVKIIFHEIADDLFKGASTTAHIPIASYYRLIITKLISEDRCLFIDGDMIITEDLSDIYNMDISEYYIAGVRDMGIQNHTEQYVNYADYLKIPTMDDYVNTGFILYNLKKMREDNLDQKFISAIAKGYKYMDQDIINKYCWGKIKYLPFRYDFFAEYYNGDFSKMRTEHPDECEKLDVPAVIHYIGIFKPWVCRRLTVNQLWLKEAEKALEEDEYETILTAASEFERKSDWTYVLERTERKKKLVIVGFSDIGRNVFERLKRAGRKNIIAFSDNDRNKQGVMYEGVMVDSPENIAKQYEDAYWINTSQNGYRQINDQLQGLGVKQDQIIRYIYKHKAYFNCLDKRYAAYEQQLIES